MRRISWLLSWLLAVELALGQAPPQVQLPPGVVDPRGQLPTLPTLPTPPPKPPAQAKPVQITTEGSAGFALNLTGATLQEVIDILARQLKMNYILDPQVRGVVTINTYGELQLPDVMPLLETILRMNGYVAVRVGNLYRIVPSKDAVRLPIPPQQLDSSRALPEDERMVLNLLPLRYVTATDIAKVLQPFLGEGAVMTVLDTGNLLLLQDNARSMRRTMDLLSLFDNESLAKQRVQLFPVKNSQATQLVKDLDAIFAAYAMSDKTSAIKFLPVERVSAILVVSPNPNVFKDVKEWIDKLDQPVTVGGIQNFIYKVQYGRADQLSNTLLVLYGAQGGFYGGGGFDGGIGGGFGGYGGFPGGGGGYGGGYPGGGGGYGGGYPGGGGGYGGGYGGGFGGGMGMGMGGGGYIQIPLGTQARPATPPAGVTGAAPGSADRTGTYLGAAAAGINQATGIGGAMVRIVPDLLNNVIIVQSTQQEYEVIRKTLGELDLPPRQVLIDAQIYEVTLTDAFASGVSAFLRQQGASGSPSVGTRMLTGFSSGGRFGLSIGHLIGQTRELLAFLDAQKSTGRTRVISAPSVIATDNLQASINVGAEIPVLTSQALVGGAQVGGTNLFTNTITNRSTGVLLSITARVNASGIVTMIINQEVSTPQAPAASGIQSPSIQKRSVQTQVTVEDGSTIAIGGIMQENDLYSTARLPVLGKIPFLGAAFGATSITKSKTELIILLTPRVIYDENEMRDTTEELKTRLRTLRRLMKG